jgi:osmotically-inducible protein OsmY
MKSDAQIQQDVLNELAWDTRLAASAIAVEVKQGLVTLSGCVDSYARYLAAADATQQVLGVREVMNDVAVHLPAHRRPTDRMLARAVRHTLQWDVLISGAQIESKVADGWITLLGTVNQWAQRHTAECAVRTLRGVRGITNTITVQTSSGVPETLGLAIEAALRRRVDGTANQVSVTVQDGTVTLTGPVRSWRELRTIAGAVEHAQGVQHVVNRLHVDPHTAVA